MSVRFEDILRSLIFYVVFYFGASFYVLAAFPTMLFGQDALLSVSKKWSAYHRFCAKWILGIHVVVEGELPEKGVLVAMKHESFFEAIDMPFLLNLPSIFAKAALLRIPFWGRIGTAYGLVGVDREQGAMALRSMIVAARKVQKQGRLLAIFPEGTRSPGGAEGPIQSGFAGIYKLMGQPVVPIAVDSGRLYHRRWKRKGTITYKVGEEIPAGLPRAEVEARVKAAINALNA